MNCPEQYVISTKHLKVLHWQKADVRREFVTWAEVLNPLRYEISIGLGPGRYWTLNNDAWMRVAWSNFWWRLKVGCWWRGHDFVKSRFYPGAETCHRCFKVKRQNQ